jgi:hypothetical protein
MKAKDLFLINWKTEKLGVALVIWLFSFLLHNFLHEVSPPLSIFFFILTIFVVPLYFLISIIYSLAKK